MARSFILIAVTMSALGVFSPAAPAAEAGARPSRGDSREAVIALLGDPQGTISTDIASSDRAANDEILCYADFFVEVSDGVVTRVRQVGHWDAPAPMRVETSVEPISDRAPEAMADAAPRPVVESSSRVADSADSTYVPSVGTVIVVEQRGDCGYRDDDRHEDARRERSCQASRDAPRARSAGCAQYGQYGRYGIYAHLDPDPSRERLAPAHKAPVDPVRDAPDPRQKVFDQPDPRAAVLAAPDPRWHGDPPR